MAIKKSELYSSLWASCDELRGGMDASQYKDYVLVLLFVKYVSDKYAGAADALIEVPEGGGFDDMVALRNDKEIGDKMNKIISKLADQNQDLRLKGVIDMVSFNDEDKLGKGKEMVDRLSNLVGIFESIDFGRNRAEGDDLLGDAYEYLMRHFATQSGKSKGQFYTPAEVSRVMAQIIGLEQVSDALASIYDPTCGSGSLLIKAHDEAKYCTGFDLALYGQEMDNATAALAKMNMVLHDCITAEIWQDNTLSAPYFKDQHGGLMTFDFAVANPPFSAKSWTNGVDTVHDPFRRFAYGVPPDKNGDYAFLLHMLKSLKSTGKGAIILPHGVLFRGNKEADIRRRLLEQGFIKGVIGLPANLFYGTGIPACIIVLDKKNAHARKGVFMLDASKGFSKDGNKNRLRAQDIHKIVDVFKRQAEVPRYARMVPLAEIADPKNDFNLNIPRYIDAGEAEDLHDLDAHLNGGIPDRDLDELAAYWRVFPSLRGELFAAHARPGYSVATLDSQAIKAAILNHPEFSAYAAQVTALFAAWREAHTPRLRGLEIGANPKELIYTLAEDLLLCYAGQPLLSRYEVYQRLLDYWAEVMQDDVYLIATDGWLEAAKPRGIIDDKQRKIKETPDLVVAKAKYKMDLLPPALIVARYFAAEQAALDALQARQESAARELEEFVEEHSGEEGLLADALTDTGKVSKSSVSTRLKALKGEADSDEERAAVARCLALIEAEADAARAVKDAQAALDKQVLAKYPNLSADDIKTLVVDDKWLAAIQTALDGEVQRLTQHLAGRIKQLEERYAAPVSVLAAAVDELAARVDGHLEKMGFVRG